MSESTPHNPDNLTPEQIGTADGWRLLDKDEVFPRELRCERWQLDASDMQNWHWSDGNFWIYEGASYRTRLTRQELLQSPRGVVNPPAIIETICAAASAARGTLESIRDLVANLDRAAAIEDEDARDREYGEATEAICLKPLAVEVRQDWKPPGHTFDDNADSPAEFRILLSTGGPAVRIVGELGPHAEPVTARLECQDWATPWTEVRLEPEEEADLLTFCQTLITYT